MKIHEVVITGYGMINGVGNNANDAFSALLAGKSGVDIISHFDASNEKVRIACEVKNFNPDDVMDKKEQKKADRFIHLGLQAVAEAMQRANIKIEDIDRDRFGVCGATGIGGLPTIERNVISSFQKGAKGVSPFFVPSTITNMLSGYVSIYHDLRGPNLSSTTACTAGLHAITEAAKTIMLGGADAMVAVGAEACICPIGLRGFANMNALSTRNDDPAHASRPFDKDRDGFVLGEGAGAIILEEYEHAVKRGATIYAELLGGGMSADAHHMTAPHPEGLGAYLVMKNCLEDAGLTADEVDHINMHGTSTPLGDQAESSAISKLFGQHAYDIQINSTKSMTGHLLGAAGVIEAIAALGAIIHGIVPPTINHFTDDEKIDSRLNFTFNKAVKKDVKVAMSNTFGFGGHNACVLFKKI